MHVIHSEAIFGYKTRKGLVKITFNNQEVVVNTTDAKRIAYDLLDVAHAADGDAFMVHFFMKEFNLPIENAAAVLDKFRQERIRMNGES